MVKKLTLCLAAILLCALALLFVLPSAAEVSELDAAAVNDIAQSIAERWDSIHRTGGLPFNEYDLDYSVIDSDGVVVAVTSDLAALSLNEAVRNRDTILDVSVAGQVVGKVLFHNDTARGMADFRRDLTRLFAAALALSAALCGGLLFYIHRSVIAPFERMKGFARRVAAGDLDVPLEMDRSHLFGAFTESFDLLREELRKSRAGEREAVKAKRELVASLSHDIKTPVASIKAVAELSSVNADAEARTRLRTIIAKAEQIDALITDMFHVTLEELQELSVSVAEVPSGELAALIAGADYLGTLEPFVLPECIARADPVRFAQVADNIIANSYKYAGTGIAIRSDFSREDDVDYLLIEILDFGPGVSPNDLPLLRQKYFRGANANGKSGYGLGLYISQVLMEMQGGDLNCRNNPGGGFSVTLRLALA
jgi:signal transduction histidine kinase